MGTQCSAEERHPEMLRGEVEGRQEMGAGAVLRGRHEGDRGGTEQEEGSEAKYQGRRVKDIRSRRRAERARDTEGRKGRIDQATGDAPPSLWVAAH